MTARLLSCGETAVLVELRDLDEVLALDAVLRPRLGSAELAGVLDLVPAARTLLVTVEAPAQLARVRAAVRDAAASLDDLRLDQLAGGTTEIRVTYDGPDLEQVGRLTGLGAHGVIAAHTGRSWRVAFSGFAPGFAYLVGGDPRLDVPRRPVPRPRVPAGAVGLAGRFSGVYPRASPGGWQVIGRTDAVLWDLDRAPPSLLTPGSWVRFVEGPGAAGAA